MANRVAIGLFSMEDNMPIKRAVFKILEFVEILIRAWQLRKKRIKGTNKNIWENVQ